jgi:hypothetical protein
MTQQNPTKLPLLRSESSTEFLALRTRLTQELKPQGAIEEYYRDDIGALMWEVRRLQIWRISTIELASGPALRRLLKYIFLNDGDKLPDPFNADQRARVLAQAWLESDPTAKDEVTNVLGRVGLDGSAIEAEAVKLSIEHLQSFDRSLAVASARLEKGLRMVMDYRNGGFANRLRQVAEQILSEPEAAQPVDGADTEQKAAA